MLRGPKVFVVCGRNTGARNSLLKVLSDLGADPHVLSRDRKLGRPIPTELERVVFECDAAIVLATGDDVGALRGSALQPRARENVWIELGWFWAALGLERTLVVTDSSIEPPSDLQGVFRLIVRRSPREVRVEIGEWLRNLAASGSADGVDLVRSTTDPGVRTADYQSIHLRALRTLLITGIGMINVRQDIPALATQLAANPDLSVTFMVPSMEILDLQASRGLVPYRTSLGRDVASFVADLRADSGLRPNLARIRLLRYPKVMTFVATAADLDEMGSSMLVEFPLEALQHGLVERPRLLLKRRTEKGLYDRFSSALRGMVRIANEESLGQI